MFLGIEIGGTKLQLGLGCGDGEILRLWRGAVDPAAGGAGIRRQIAAAVPELLDSYSSPLSERGQGGEKEALRGVGIGFGGPTDDATQSVVTSHQVAGWDGFPLAAWAAEEFGAPAVVCNDADTAGLGEALFGAGKGLSPVFYITVGTGVGGGLVIDGDIYRGVGRGAAEIGHLPAAGTTVEGMASGRSIERRAESVVSPNFVKLRERELVTVPVLAREARAGDRDAAALIQSAVEALADGIAQVVTLLCPRRVVVGGGVSLMGDDLFFGPLRAAVAARTFAPFAGLTDVVPAALGESVVVHGALALARKRLRGNARLATLRGNVLRSSRTLLRSVARR